MARDLSANSIAAVALKEGLEPVLILHFDMPGQVYYSTKDVNDLGDAGKILEFSGLNQTVKVNSVASVSNISVTLDDSNRLLKDLLNIYNIEGTVVQGYLYFDGLAGGAPGTQIFKGRVVGPTFWSESERRLHITIESFINSRRVGFAMESGQFTVNNEIAAGKVWPILFGKVPHVPAVLAQKKPAAILKYPINMGGAIGEQELYTMTGGANSDDFEISDWTLLQSYNVDEDDVVIDYGVFYVENSDEFPKDTDINVVIDGVVFNGKFLTAAPNVFIINEANAVKYTNIEFLERPLIEDDSDAYDPHVAWIDEQYLTLVEHSCYFEQASTKNSNIDTGGEAYIIRKVVKQDGNKIWFEHPLRDLTRENILLDDTIGIINKVRALPQNGLMVDLVKFSNQVKRLLKGRAVRQGSASNPYGQLIETLQLIKFVKGAFWNRKEGTEIRLWDEAEADIYVVNAVPSTSLTSVYGVRRVNNLDQFVPIPTHYYEVTLDEATLIDEEDGPTNVTTLRFTLPLSSYKEQGWKDEIYVTVQSELSSNPVEVIEYLIENYTDLEVDTDTFNAVAAEIDDYESHFAIFKHQDALQLCEEIAYQARLGLVIDSGTVKVVNLAKEESAVFTFTEGEVEFQSLNQTTIDSNNLVTRHVGKYRSTYEPEVSSAGYNKIYEFEERFEQNIEEYGLIEREINYFIFRNREQVAESVEFWGNRDSKVWKIVEFTAFHDSIILEPFDTVQFSMDFFYLGSSSTKGVIIGINNNIINGIIRYTAMLPLEAGSSSQDDLFWNFEAITTPTNPADDLHQIEYDIQEEKQEISINEFIQILEGHITRQRVLARNKNNAPFRSEYLDIANMDILTDGPEAPPEYSNVKVDLTNNHIDPEDGELIYVNKDNNSRYYAPTRWGIHSVRIKAINDDTLTVCFVDEIADPEVEFDTFEVTKPYTIMRTTWDGQIIDGVTYFYVDEQTRDATDGSNNETQVINPPYHIDDIIDIAYTLNYGGGWIDLNTDARTWVAECTGDNPV